MPRNTKLIAHVQSLEELQVKIVAGHRKRLEKGYPREKIPVLAKEIETDLVVMGTVARIGIPGFFMGNTAETILNQLDCSVLAIKPQGFKTPVTLED